MVRCTPAMHTASINDWTWVSEAWTRDWLARDTELVEKYKPEIVYFDWWIGQPNFRRAVTEFAAFYYNYAAAHGYTGVINFKDYSLNWKAARATSSAASRTTSLPITGRPTPPSATIWGYIEHDTFKSPEFLVHQLVDIVSKNGNLLLNFGPRADGTIPDEIRKTLLEMGAWLKVNGEAIYGTTPWKTFGEGPTQVRAAPSTTPTRSPTLPQIFASPRKETRFTPSAWPAPRMARQRSTPSGTAQEGAHRAYRQRRVAWFSRKGHLDADRRCARDYASLDAACKYAYTLKLTPSRQIMERA